MPNKICEIGNRYGRLLVISECGINNNKKVLWLCKCDCGNEKKIVGGNLRSGGSKSCGCLAKELSRDRETKHGMYGSRTYSTWSNMISRCSNKKNPDYKYYGGRGILVCEEWKEFENFYRDMGDRPNKKSIDRINNDGNYYKENCKWSTQSEQIKNRRRRGECGLNTN